jgi:hypothetical protein
MIEKLHDLTSGKTDLPAFLKDEKYLATVWRDIII